MTRHEQTVLHALIDAVVAPEGELPAPQRTDAGAFVAGYLARAPALNRTGLRAVLLALDAAPLALGFARPLHRLARAQRAACLTRLLQGRAAHAVEPLVAVAKLAYYGDDGVMRLLGYDPDRVTARGRALRTAEVRW